MGHDDVLLAGVRVVSIAINLPGPAAARRLARLGAEVTKVEPPTGDQMELLSASYYRELCEGQRIVRLDLKSEQGRAELWQLLEGADLFLTSNRPSALARLGLDWESVHARLPKLSQVAIVGYPGDRAEVAGHDLTYQASVGTLQPPNMPRVLLADLTSAERAVGDALAAVLSASRTGVGSYREVALSSLAEMMGDPARHGLTTSDGILGGSLPQYAMYPAADGHVVLAALEPHFWARTREQLGIEGTREELTAIFATRGAEEWEAWGAEHDIPLAAVRGWPRPVDQRLGSAHG
ncbi:CaiB/BaiF CoA-transferase family protein [Luteococcus sp. H138]|uniref:CaiB/BaiF CoA-transferase family protein n=1 Tax=unclassified Luteococcus TaxID=2639923 RepID=UPI00313B0EF5